MTSSASAQTGPASVDEAVRKAVIAGESTRVIMQFDTTTERDAAFNRLLDGGAAVRTMDTADGPALNVISSASTAATEFANARQVSFDAPVSVFHASKSTAAKPAGSKTPARDKTGARPRAKAPSPLPNYASLSIAVVDSGLQVHPDLLGSRVRKYVDFVSGGSSPYDRCGHGTHVAGTIAGDGEMSGGEIRGVNPTVDLVVLRVLGDDCSGRTSDVIDALEWVAANHAKYNIRVVNLSLGHPVYESAVTDPLVQAVERLSRKGIVVVAAAGNMGINPLTSQPGYGGVGVPCNAPSSVCVGAMNAKGTPDFSDDTITPFSSRGPTRFDLLAKPDLVANGVNATAINAQGSKLDLGSSASSHIKGRFDSGKPSYLRLSGTSMAAPRVAGITGLVIAANPGLSANAVKMILQFTARVLPGVDVLTQGAGAINTNGAVIMARRINPQARPGTNWLTAPLPMSNTGNDQVITWGQHIVWGDRDMASSTAAVHMARWDDNVVWGFDALADNIVWGNCDGCDNIVWGNTWDDNIVWGNDWDDNIVWGNNVVWGNNILWGYWADNIVWGFWDDNVVWGNVTRSNWDDNIVWGNDWDNIVWGNCSAARNFDDNIVWGNNDCFRRAQE